MRSHRHRIRTQFRVAVPEDRVVLADLLFCLGLHLLRNGINIVAAPAFTRLQELVEILLAPFVEACETTNTNQKGA